MKIQSIILENFASFKNLEFSFNNKGLALIQGATGSGKSTLCDAVPWILFGKTAKNGAVDEVLSWPGNEVTKGTIYLDNVTISRSRGPKSKDNDLMFWPTDGVATRGKDLNDTQKLINSFLGFDCDLYLSGAYFHEFSQTASFFTTTAKNRRAICEQMVELELPKKLQLAIAAKSKEVGREILTTTTSLAVVKDKKETFNNLFESTRKQYYAWENRNKVDSELAQKQFNDFEAQRAAQIEQLSVEKKALSRDIKPEEYFRTKEVAYQAKKQAELHAAKCPTCGQVKSQHTAEIDSEYYKIQKERFLNTTLIKDHSRLIKEIDKLESEVNPYKNQIVKAENPHSDNLLNYNNQVFQLSASEADLNQELTQLKTQDSDLSILSDIINDFRGLLVKNAIIDVENRTNVLLADYFDAEIKVRFTVEEADKVEVIIQKDGNTCVYTQLSKGQRQLLKFCFGIAVMRAVSNHHGVEFSQIFMDEALDGLSEEFKVKAYRLLQSLELEYDSIFIVEHSAELKALFDRQYLVTLVNGNSQIEET